MSRMKQTVVSTVAHMIIPSGKSEAKSPMNSLRFGPIRSPRRYIQLGRPVSERSHVTTRRKNPEITAPHAGEGGKYGKIRDAKRDELSEY